MTDSQAHVPRGGWHLASYLAAHLMILVVSAVLTGAFIYQFALGEKPCPLCLLQRMCMILAAIGPAVLIISGQKEPAADRTSLYATAYGMTITASVLGMAVSARQVLLHIAPGDSGFGDPVFGMHLYTWALIVFLALCLSSGIHLLFAKALIPAKPQAKLHWLSHVTLWYFAALIFLNCVTSFALTGFHWFVPDNPTDYQLL